MELVKLGRKGQVTLPASLLRRQDLEGDSWLIAEPGENGVIVLRPAAEIYTDERITEFDREGQIDPDLDRQVQAYLDRDG